MRNRMQRNSLQLLVGMRTCVLGSLSRSVSGRAQTPPPTDSHGRHSHSRALSIHTQARNVPIGHGPEHAAAAKQQAAAGHAGAAAHAATVPGK